MAKQPETQDRYRIHVDDIPIEALGIVLAALTRLGITNVTPELVTDILAYKHKAAPRVFDVPSLDLARTFISQHHAFKAKELITVFEQDGRSAAVGYSMLKRLVEAGELRRLEAGRYQSATIKALEAPASEAEADLEAEPAKPNGKGRRYPTTNIVVVWSAINRRKMVTRAEIVEIMEANDRPKKSVDGLVGKLKEMGRLKSVSGGKYEIIKPAKEE